MIKTTSFASRPGQTSSNPSSKVAARQNAIKAARARATAQPTLTGLFDAPTPAPEISASQAREIIQSAAPETKTAAPTQPVVSPVLASLPVEPEPTPKKAPRAAKTKVAALPVEVAPVAVEVRTKTKDLKTAANVEVASETVEVRLPPESRAQLSEVEVAPEAAKDTPSVPAAQKPVAKPKTKRARVPANLAEQYGQNLSKRAESGVEIVPAEDETPKKRMTRVEREARRELMKPDDDLRARLERAHNVVSTRKPEKRPAGWRFDCGRCGQTSYFQTGGALCRCGAVAIKE